jgi:hypothetical protein
MLSSFSRDTTFMLSGISNFERKRVENLVNCQKLLFTGTKWHSNFGCNLCKNCWEKHHRAFVKVVEGSVIYNFPIHHLVHFYSNFWRFSRSNQGTVKQFRVSRALRRDIARLRRPPSASAPPCLLRPAFPPRPCAFPGRPRPMMLWSPHRATRQHAVRAVPRPVAHPAVQRSVRGFPPPCTVPRRHLHRHPFVTSMRAPLFKGRCPPPSHTPCQCSPPWPPPKQAPVLELFHRRPTPPAPSLPHTRALAPACRQALPPPRRSRGHCGGRRLASTCTTAGRPSAPTLVTNEP